MMRWVICSTGSGGPLYCPTNPQGVQWGTVVYPWAPWTPYLEFAKRFDSQEDADAFLVAMALEGYPMEPRIPMALAMG
jgi:hypothetical protein